MASQAEHIEMAPYLTGDHVNIRGTAVIELTVAKDGSVRCAQALSGHPLAISQLIGAVQKWRFKPFVKDGVALQFCGRLRVKFAVVENRPSVEVVGDNGR
jgi:hypothetical protein